MKPRPLYLVQPTYDGRDCVIGPGGFAQICPDMVAAHALAKTLNEQHARTQALASNVLAVHFPINIPKDIA